MNVPAPLAWLAVIIHRFKLALSILIMIVFAIFVQRLEYAGLFSSAEAKLANMMVQTDLAWSDITTVAVDQDAYAAWFVSRSPLDPCLVLQIVSAIAAAEPRSIGVDLLTDAPEYASHVTGADVRTCEATGAAPLSTQQPPIPIVWAADALPQRLDGKEKPIEPDVHFWEWMLGQHAPVLLRPGPVLGRYAHDLRVPWGVPIFPRDGDGAVRRVARTWTEVPFDSGVPQPRPYPSFARVLAERSCPSCRTPDEPDEAIIAIPKTTGSMLELSQLFDCPNSEPPVVCRALALKTNGPTKPIEQLRGKIVLLGATFAEARDVHVTAYAEKTPGLLLNALAVANERGGPMWTELSRVNSLLIDLVVGLAIVAVFEFATVGLAPKIVICVLGVGVGSTVFGIFLSRLRTLWLGWVVMLIFGLAWHVLFDVLLEQWFPEHHEDSKLKAQTTQTR